MIKRVTSVAVAALIVCGALSITSYAQGRGGGAAAAPFDPRNISGFWTLPADGRKIPQAKLLPRITKAMLDLHSRRDMHAMRWCNLPGTPFAMDSGTPLDIRVGPTTIIVAPENDPAPRYLYLGRTHVGEDVYDNSTNGDSIANWDGDTLVVDTIGFHATRGISSIPGGGFKTDKSHLVERYKLLDNGNVLSVTFTWTDPTVYAAPHSYEFHYRRLPSTYEPIPLSPCDPYDETRAAFLGDPAPFQAPKK